MKSVYKIGYFQETEALFQFRFSIMKDNVTMTLDLAFCNRERTADALI